MGEETSWSGHIPKDSVRPSCSLYYQPPLILSIFFSKPIKSQDYWENKIFSILHLTFIACSSDSVVLKNVKKKKKKKAFNFLSNSSTIFETRNKIEKVSSASSNCNFYLMLENVQNFLRHIFIEHL